MALRITCPACKTSLKLDDDARGTKIQCSECDKTLNIPAANGIKAKPAPAPADDEEEEEERPAKKKKKKGKKSKGPSPVLLIAGVAVVVVLVLGGVGASAVYLLRGDPAKQNQQAKLDPKDKAGDQKPKGEVKAPLAKAAQEPPVLSVDANDLYEAYHENEAKADGLYNGKRLEVIALYHGTVEFNKPRKNKDGKWVMVFHHTGELRGGPAKSSPNWWWGQWNSPTTVIVYFLDSEATKLADVHAEKGATGKDGLIVTGVCGGFEPGPSWTGFGKFVKGNPTVVISNAVVVREFTDDKPVGAEGVDTVELRLQRVRLQLRVKEKKKDPFESKAPSGGIQFSKKGSGSLISNVRGSAYVTERKNELKNIGLFFIQYANDIPNVNKRTLDGFLSTFQRDAPKIYEHVKEENYVINLKASLSASNGIIAYEWGMYPAGYLCVRVDGSVDYVSQDEWKAALGIK